MSDSPLGIIEQLLKDEDFGTRLLEKSEERPFELLFVGVGEDAKKRGYTMQVHYVNDVASAVGGQDQPDDAYILQFFLVFPFLVDQEQLGPVGRAILAINRILPVGAFGLSEQEGTPYYQYNLASSERLKDKKVLLEIMSIMGFFTCEFSTNFEAISKGEMTYEAMLE